MKEIIILDKFPVVLTKEKNWRPKHKLKPGAILVLPEDAILVLKAKEEK